MHVLSILSTGVDPGFLEREFTIICIKVLGIALLIYQTFIKYPMKMDIKYSMKVV